MVFVLFSFEGKYGPANKLRNFRNTKGGRRRTEYFCRPVGEPVKLETGRRQLERGPMFGPSDQDKLVLRRYFRGGRFWFAKELFLGKLVAIDGYRRALFDQFHQKRFEKGEGPVAKHCASQRHRSG